MCPSLSVFVVSTCLDECYAQGLHCAVCHLKSPRGILLRGLVALLGTQMYGRHHLLETLMCGHLQLLLNTSESLHAVVLWGHSVS